MPRKLFVSLLEVVGHQHTTGHILVVNNRHYNLIYTSSKL